MRGRQALTAAAVVVAMATLVACGGGSKSKSSSSQPKTTAAANPDDFQGPGLLRKEYVKVVPSTNLADGQMVQVSGRGFTPNKPLAFNECLATVRGYSDCDPTTTKNSIVTTGADGTFPPTPYTLHTTIKVPSRANADVTCGPDQCSVGVGDVAGTTAGSHCIAFGSSTCTYQGVNK